MQLPAFNVTVILSIALVMGAVYGVVAGKQRLRILILSIYVGVVLAEQLADSIAPMITFLSREQLSWALFGVPILFFGFFGVMHAKGHSHGAFIANVIVGLLTAALVTSSILKLLPTSHVEWLANDSFLALHLTQAHPWLLGLLPLVALLLGLMRGEKHH